MTDSIETSASRLRELALVFLKLGVTAFGGPVAHIALMEQEFVQSRKWLSRDEFLDLVSAANLIPGPNSTELAIHVGRRRAGRSGLIIAGICFILPAAVMASILASVYLRFGKLPEVQGILYAVKPVIIAIVAQALWRLARTAVKTLFLGAMGAVGVGLSFLGVSELAILLGGGLLMLLPRLANRPGSSLFSFDLPMLGAGALSSASILSGSGAVAGSAVPFALWPMCGVFLKIGSILFGSGYVLLAFLRADFVSRLGWLTEGQLIDAIAVGQVTPGPMLSTATFIGFLLGGPTAAFCATVAIFVPAFVFVGISAPFIPRIRGSHLAGGFLDGANIASLALMGVASWRLGFSAIRDWQTALLFAGAIFLLIRFNLNFVWLVLGACVLGLVLK